MTLLPTVPRFSDRPASRASRNSARSTPKLRLAAWVPAIDWNTRSTGKPCPISPSVVVTWVSTQPCVGICSRAMMSSSSRTSEPMMAGSSLAGLMPMQASPDPSKMPSRIEAVMPLVSSKGWLGCRRTLIRPGKPMLLRNRVVTRHFFATRIRSWLRISFETAAAISGVMPRESFASASPLAASDNSQSRNAPTVSDAIAAKPCASWLSTIRRVTSSSS